MPATNDSGLYPNEEVFTGIKAGSIIAYKLKSSDMLLNPNKVWRGKVKYCGTTGVVVEMLEPDYTGLTEVVTYEQVIAVE